RLPRIVYKRQEKRAKCKKPHPAYARPAWPVGGKRPAARNCPVLAPATAPKPKLHSKEGPEGMQAPTRRCLPELPAHPPVVPVGPSFRPVRQLVVPALAGPPSP